MTNIGSWARESFFFSIKNLQYVPNQIKVLQLFQSKHIWSHANDEMWCIEFEWGHEYRKEFVSNDKIYLTIDSIPLDNNLWLFIRE